MGVGQVTNRKTRLTLTLLGVCALLLPAAGDVFAAGGGGGGSHHGFSLKEHGFYIVNFILFVAIFVVVARKPIAAALKSRSDAFANRLAGARKEYEATQGRLAEARGKVEMVEMEAGAVVQRMGEEGRRLQSTIEERAGREEKKIQQVAEASLASEKTRMEKQFQAQISRQALDLAEERLKSSWPQLPQDLFVREFVDRVSAEVRSDGGKG